MKESSEIFELINGMKRTEKAYFKKLSGLHSDSKEKEYLILFDVIEKQKSYDEEKVKKKLPDKSLIKRLPVLKNYLLKQLHRSLRLYNQGYNTNTEIKELMFEGELLFDKGLFSLAEKYMNKAVKLARQFERWELLLDIYQKQLEEQDLNQGWEGIEKIINERVTVMERLTLQTKLDAMLYQIRAAHARIHIASTRGEHEEIKKMLDWESVEAALTSVSFRAKMTVYKALSTYYRMANNKPKSYLYRKLLIYHFVDHPHQKEVYAHDYARARRNMLTGHVEIEDYLGQANARRELSEMLKDKKLIKSEKIRNSYLLYAQHSKLEEYRFSGNIDLYIGELSNLLELKDFVERGDPGSTEILRFYFELARINFYLENYQESLRWLNKVRNRPEIASNMYWMHNSWLLTLIVHFELENMELLVSQTRSFYRRLKLDENEFGLAKILLRFIKGSVNINTRDELLQQFDGLHKELLGVLENEFERRLFDYFDYPLWVESKIERRKYLDVLREKLRSRGKKGFIN